MARSSKGVGAPALIRGVQSAVARSRSFGAGCRQIHSMRCSLWPFVRPAGLSVASHLLPPFVGRGPIPPPPAQAY
eukprot:8722971-Lingulodinium_polyedra.AAC.1